MAPLKAKGDLADMMVAAGLLRRGHKIAFPFGEDWDYDLILCRAETGGLERVQVAARCRSHSLTNGRVRQTKRYTAKTMDWIAVWDATTGGCFYVPAEELGDGRDGMSLRLTPAANGQQRGIRWAKDYTTI